MGSDPLRHTAHLYIWGIPKADFTFVFRLKFRGPYPSSPYTYRYETYSVSRHLWRLLKTSFTMGYTPKLGSQGWPNFHIGPIVRHLAVIYMQVEQSWCVLAVAGRTPQNIRFTRDPCPPTNFVQGVSNMVNFDESCVFRGPYGARVHLTGKLFISYNRGVTVVWPSENWRAWPSKFRSYRDSNMGDRMFNDWRLLNVVFTGPASRRRRPIVCGLSVAIFC